MSEKSILPRLLELSAKRFGKEGISLSGDQDLFETLGIDSYQAMELLTELEQEFQIEIPDYELQGVNTFAGIATIIEKRL